MRVFLFYACLYFTKEEENSTSDPSISDLLRSIVEISLVYVYGVHLTAYISTYVESKESNSKNVSFLQ